MNLLLVSATENEVNPLLSLIRSPEQSSAMKCLNYKHHSIDLLITGVGMVATAYHVAKSLPGNYHLVVNAGICGSFNRNLEIGSVVNVYEDVFSELGAQDDENFLSLTEIGLSGISGITNGTLLNATIEQLPKVNGITVNTVHGNEDAIQKVIDRLHPTVESMEGAAFMYSCQMENVPYVQLRAVSNYVEKRNRENWDIPLAIKNLNIKLIEVLNSL